MAEEARKHLDAKVLNKIARLELKARHMVEGFVAGMHRSPYQGFSVEFAEHREYAPGDDLRHLDWKVFGRSDRLYIKEYELETNLRAHILLDTSESMSYGSEELTKLDLASTLAASMAYLILRQQDAVSLISFDKEIRSFLPSSNSMGHIRSILTALGLARPTHKTDLGAILHSLAERFHQRGMVILISDLFDNPERTLRGLQHLCHRGHEVIVFHVLDEYELSFPFQRLTLFEGLEELPKILAEPRALRAAYLDEVNAFCKRIERECMQMMADYVRVSTDQQLDTRLAEYLARRLGTHWKRR
jgi:uncharacterized protein (DUF58 family)